jgi:hypothetical protein
MFKGGKAPISWEKYGKSMGDSPIKNQSIEQCLKLQRSCVVYVCNF